MKLQKIRIFFLLICFLMLSGCTKNEEPLTEIEVTLGPYMMVFPLGFRHIPEQGIDSSPGTVTNGKMEFYYDYGYYNGPTYDFPGEEEVTEEVIEGHYFQITIPMDPQNGMTSIYLYRLSDAAEEEEGGLLATLRMSVTSITPKQQELAISIFRSFTIVTPGFN